MGREKNLLPSAEGKSKGCGMDKELKDRWVAALRSGDYTQNKHYLETSCGNCCLGVLCRVAGLHPEPKFSTHLGIYAFEGSTNNLSKSQLSSLGLALHHSCDLIKMNDKDGLSFSEIADYIETHID